MCESAGGSSTGGDTAGGGDRGKAVAAAGACPTGCLQDGKKGAGVLLVCGRPVAGTKGV